MTPLSFPTTANILDPIHDGLSPAVWDDPQAPTPKLKEQHDKWITKTVIATLEGAGYTNVEDWLSLVLTGSLTTYQYSDESDVDVSLFVNTEVFPEWSRGEMIGLMVGKVDGTELPGTPFPLQCFVVPSSVTKEELYQPGLRSGYDLFSDSWIVPPDHERVHDVEREMNASYVYALECADKMERLLRYEPDKAVTYWHQIHKRRQRDQKAGKGDYSQANIVYKFLANRGLFPQISEASGEYIARTAGRANVAKFVYDVPDNYLLIGKMGPEEGVNESHRDLMGVSGIDPKNAAFGQIREDGIAETFGRPRIAPDANRNWNQYEVQYRTEEAVRRAVPGIHFLNEQELLNPEWELESDPRVQFLGAPVEVPTPNDSVFEQADPAWVF